MSRTVYRYTFRSAIPAEDIENSLLLALWATESLHGESLVRLEAKHAFDADQLCCVIEASSPVGDDLNRLFVGFIRREFGDDSFGVERLDHRPEPQNLSA